jgi:hypothetical protein
MFSLSVVLVDLGKAQITLFVASYFIGLVYFKKAKKAGKNRWASIEGILPPFEFDGGRKSEKKVLQYF